MCVHRHMGCVCVCVQLSCMCPPAPLLACTPPRREGWAAPTPASARTSGRAPPDHRRTHRPGLCNPGPLALPQSPAPDTEVPQPGTPVGTSAHLVGPAPCPNSNRRPALTQADDPPISPGLCDPSLGSGCPAPTPQPRPVCTGPPTQRDSAEGHKSQVQAGPLAPQLALCAVWFSRGVPTGPYPLPVRPTPHKSSALSISVRPRHRAQPSPWVRGNYSGLWNRFIWKHSKSPWEHLPSAQHPAPSTWVAEQVASAWPASPRHGGHCPHRRRSIH